MGLVLFKTWTKATELACSIYSFQNHHYSYSYSRKKLHYSLDLCLFSKMLPLFPGIFPQNNGFLQFSVYNFLKLTDFEKIDLKKTDLKKIKIHHFPNYGKIMISVKKCSLFPAYSCYASKKGHYSRLMLGIFFFRKRFIIPATYAGIYGAGQPHTPDPWRLFRIFHITGNDQSINS